MKLNKICFLPFVFLFSIVQQEILFAQDHSIARTWNEVILESIRNDFARPTVHARNLFHMSAMTYDIWTIFNKKSKPYFLNQNKNGVYISYEETSYEKENEKALHEAISYASYRYLYHRYEVSPKFKKTKDLIDSVFCSLGYDPNFKSTNYKDGSSAALGNYIAKQVIDYGWRDGSNEKYFYTNLFYEPVNQPLILKNPGSQEIKDPNRWQPLAFEKFIDQSGNEIPGSVPPFLGPEWGLTWPFSLDKSDLKLMNRDDFNFPVYYDPGPPPEFLDSDCKINSEFWWNHSYVSIWSSHLDPNDGVLWDISPGGIGNLDFSNIKYNVESLKGIYSRYDGGDFSNGYKINPITNKPYEKQLVPRGDYTRVIAEFWADGPDSETPPGHWFTILNYVSDHNEFDLKFEGKEKLTNLEWDIKAYFILGGAMHDAAIAAWGIKGFYDYIRPISAIRMMSDYGQSSDPNIINYNPLGIKLEKGYVELVNKKDRLAGKRKENIGKIKLRAWKGHDYISNTETDNAGVGWILAENWWPYQRPTFVTPNFAGYISGHSTYSRAAAEVLTLLTGSEYFPGGMGEYTAKKNKFLVFEEGPTRDIKIQWATYRDASNQCSLSRIWGGIHPPVDDLPGRVIGEKIGIKAFDYGKSFFQK